MVGSIILIGVIFAFSSLTEGYPSDAWNQGACDPDAWANEKGPCCSSWGWCGNSDGHCSCPTCVDYRGKDFPIPSFGAPVFNGDQVQSLYGGGASGSYERTNNPWAWGWGK